MKLIKFTNLLVMASLLAFGSVGCKKRPTPLTELPPGRVGQPGGPGPGDMIGIGTQPSIEPTSSGIAESDEPGHIGWTENADTLKADSVYFDFDSAAVKDSELSKVAAVADYLKANPQAAVRVEGNCDERGTEEYNRSLGERRALAARERLVGLGIDPTRVDTRSYGEDRPANPGHNEEAWRENRRDDFILLTPP